MTIKTIPIRSKFHPYLNNDCIVLRIWEPSPQHIELSFPFHEDTPNFNLTISEALHLRNAINQLIDIKLIESKEDITNG